MAKKNQGGLVYSTEFGTTCPECRQPVDACVCNEEQLPEGDGIVRLSRESKGRGGKVVTLITGVPLVGSELKRSEEHTSELQSRPHLVCRLLLEKKNSVKDVVATEKRE